MENNIQESKQNKSVLAAIVAFVAVVLLVGAIGYFTSSDDETIIQGQVEAEEYRVSSKVPGRILEILVKEGDFVHAGDTLAILDCPDIEAKKTQAESATNAADALSDMAAAGARREQVAAAYQLWQQAQAALEIARKSYERVSHLADEGVVSAQKRDEAYASYKAVTAQEQAAKSQYEMAKNGARKEEIRAANAQADRARGAVSEVNSYLKETVQLAQADGEVTDIYVKVGELVGSGAPIMTIARLSDVYATFSVREDMLNGMTNGTTFSVYCPAFNKDLDVKVYYIKDQGTFAVWKPTKSSGQYDLKTFEVRAKPVKAVEGLRPGMSLVKKD